MSRARRAMMMAATAGLVVLSGGAAHAPERFISVSISGPSIVRPNATCTFSARPSPVTGTYTYTWSQSAGTGYQHDDNLYDASNSFGYYVTVTITDAFGATATATKNVSVSTGAAPCALY